MSKTFSQPPVASPTFHVTVVFSICVFVAIILMSYVFRVEIVAKGSGKVIPTGRVQVVQPEFGGQISEILVENGSIVAKGQILVALDRTNDQAEVNTLRAETSRLRSELARIDAIVRLISSPPRLNRDEILPTVRAFEELAGEEKTEYHDQQAVLLEAELTELFDTLSQIDARIQANRKSEDVTRAGIARVESAIETQQERLDVTKSLLERGTTSRAIYLDVLDGFNRLEKERDVYSRELEQKASQEAAYLNEKLAVVSRLRSRLLTRQNSLEARQFEVEEALIASRRRLNNTSLVAPVEGIVDQLSVHTVGGIVEGGQELLRVVPTDQSFEIEATFPNADIGFLSVGQKAKIKLDAFPSERFGTLEGEILNVSADAVKINDSEFAFQVRIAPASSYLRSGSVEYPLQPGMTATVDAITGERRIISYFFAPIVKVVSDSLGER